jgi:hypothetical protein
MVKRVDALDATGSMDFDLLKGAWWGNPYNLLKLLPLWWNW